MADSDPAAPGAGTGPNAKTATAVSTSIGSAANPKKRKACDPAPPPLSSSSSSSAGASAPLASSASSEPTPAPPTAAPGDPATPVAGPSDTSAPEPEKVPRKPNPYDSIKHRIVTNDGTTDSLVKLIGLKSLFAKQLPKMPKEYIVRLVFDRRHKSLALLSPDPEVRGSDEEIIGGICYRAYPEMRFAEIAFCAVSASQQVKGYGTKLMNLLKRHAVTEGVEYFITYADNYAIGYFKKQGFTKTISMPKGRFHGLIKDYDGGTMMECYVHPSVDFTRVPEMIEAQRTFLLSRIRAVARSHRVVYPPLPRGWNPGDMEGTSRSNEAVVRAYRIPGVREAGWTLADLQAAHNAGSGGKDGDRAGARLKSDLLGLVRRVEEQQFAWPFREPVDTNEVRDYLDIVKDPIDLSTMERRVRRGDWYKGRRMLFSDMMRMVNNCKLYNDSASPYYECAVGLEKFLPSIFPEFS